MIQGIDFSAGAAGWSQQKYTDFYRAAAAAGIVFAVRYLDRPGGWPSKKQITPAELKAAMDAGVKIAFFYEEGTETPLEGASAGRRHATGAVAALTALGIDPTKQPVIFATDTDTSAALVSPYYQAIAEIVGIQNTWAYGGYFLIRGLFDRGLISGACQARAWSKADPVTGKQSYAANAVLQWEPRAQLRQNFDLDTIAAGTIAGVNTNSETATVEDYGQYPRPAGGDMTQAEQFTTIAHSRLGMEYEWSDEFTYDIGGDDTPQDDDGDCSGYLFVTYRDTGVRWKNGGLWPRLTANGFKYHAVPVSGTAYKVGDPFFRFGTNGLAVHTGFICHRDADGHWWSSEARGERWGVVTYRVDDPVNGILKRGCKVYRFPWVDMGEIPAPAYPELTIGDTGEDVKRAQLRLNVHMGPMLKGTGVFGPVTLAVTEAFQTLKHLEVDGIIGPQTWAALMEDPEFPELKINDDDEYVKLAKHWLNQKIKAGLDESNEHFGSKTDAAVRRFQTLKRLKVDGIIGVNTWAELLK